MCGIVGYIGNRKAKPILLKGLTNLEYRGYDSAGIATIEDEKVLVLKNKGRVKELEKVNGFDLSMGTVGIAHTRWATHGKPSNNNSHPHMNNSNNIVVVHNGIIENYKEVREFLIEKGYIFLSETDSEVIPNLIDYYFNLENNNDKESFLKAVKNVCDNLIGSWAICVISPLFKDSIIVTRKDSPLVIGTGENENYIASDIPALLSYTNNFYLLDNFEYGIIEKNNITFLDKNLNQINKKVNNIEWNIEASEKNGFEHYMLKEIFEQPTAIRETIGTRLSEEKVSFPELNFTKEYLDNISKINIIACGTAMHAGMAAKFLIEKLTNISVEVEIASEFRYKKPIISEKNLCIYVSQSGETADTIAALKLAKQKGAKTIAVTNVIGSSITRDADYSIYTHAGPEIAVASTKAYTSQIVLLDILAIYVAEILNPNKCYKEIKNEIMLLPEKAEKILKNIFKIKEFANKIYNEKDIFFIGRLLDYAVSLEGSLKLKEISYIHSEAYPSGELKHGPIALIENNTTVICTVTNESIIEKAISNIQEVITRGAKVLVITNQEIDKYDFDNIIQIPKVDEYLSPILSVIPLQLLAYYVTKQKRLDIDKPRNLAKSVTVE